MIGLALRQADPEVCEVCGGGSCSDPRFTKLTSRSHQAAKELQAAAHLRKTSCYPNVATMTGSDQQPLKVCKTGQQAMFGQTFGSERRMAELEVWQRHGSPMLVSYLAW